ncbi:MAG: sulfite exporter TauE/SafE family protein [Gammaproteobacteria bacterium]|nr:sulfite exporter TauE/SafE family protein [Gammaproteobacteria bacterium]
MAMVVIIFLVVFLALFVTGYMVHQLRQQPSVSVSFQDKLRLLGSGMVAFIADTLGLGSFAVNITLAKILGTFSDEELPAMNNGAQLVPGAIESLFFMQYVAVDLTTLVVLVSGACLGGLLGGGVVSRLGKQAIRVAMIAAFAFIICLLVSDQMGLLPVGGTATALHSWKLLIGFLAVMICGALTSVGVGLFAMVQAVLFILSVSPLVAFPIMMTAGAMQQPLTTFMFLRNAKQMPIKRILILSLGGCIGVAITLPIFHYLTVSWLHDLLIFLLCFNIVAIAKTYFKTRLADRTPMAAEA